MEMDSVLNVSLGDVDLTYSMTWFLLHLFMLFRRSLFQSFSSSLRLFLNSFFEHFWLLLPVNNKSCLFLCPLFMLFRWGLLIEQVFLLLLQASNCVTKGSISHTGHTCLDHTCVPNKQNRKAQNTRYPPRVYWGLVAEGCTWSFLSPLVCQPAVLTY